LVALSVLGTWAAALVAARLAERIRVGSGVVALWLVGAASPLFFDAYVIHGHTIAAALAGVAALLVVRSLEERRLWTGVVAVVAVFTVGLLRSEGVLFAMAFGGAVCLVGILRRRVDLVVVGLASGAAGPGAYLLDRAWSAAVAGGDRVRVDSFAKTGETFLSGRVTSASYTWLMPGYRGGNLAEILTMVGAFLLIAGAVVVRRRRDDPGAVVLPVAGALLLLVRAGLEWGPVPGLLLAFCVGFVGVVLIDAEVARSAVTRLVLGTSAVFAVAVALTQYAVGGHTEWGGRYFALCVPFLGAVSAAALRRASPAWPPRTALAIRASLVVAAVAMGALAVSTVRSAHERNRHRSDGVLAAALDLPTGDGRPVVVTEDNQVPRLARGRFGEVRFLLVAPSEVPRYLGRLADAQVADVLLVSTDPEASLQRLPEEYEPVGPVESHELQWDPGGGLIRLRLVGP
jgi:hypothetical protein